MLLLEKGRGRRRGRERENESWGRRKRDGEGRRETENLITWKTAGCRKYQNVYER